MPFLHVAGERWNAEAEIAFRALRQNAVCDRRVDNFGIERAGADWHDSQGRVGVVAALCAEGYADRIVLSHDSMCCVDWGQVRALRAANPDWVPTYIPDAVAPALLGAGVTEAQLEAMLTANPRRLFEAQGAY